MGSVSCPTSHGNLTRTEFPRRHSCWRDYGPRAAVRELETISALFQTLSDVNRLRIIFFLGLDEWSVHEVVKALKLSQPLVSHHLKVPKQVSIVHTTRDGPFVLYRLADRRFPASLARFLSVLEGKGEK